MEHRVIDATGKPCPIPVIEAKKALRSAATGESVRLLVDNDAARQNLQKMAEDLGCRFRHEPAAGGAALVTIVAGELKAEEPRRPAAVTGLVVAIGQECMGSGNDELGRMLMKSFVHSLTELATPPETVLLFNGGVFLATQGAGTLDDLRLLAKKGCTVSTCGACLNFHGLTDKLAVGGITNMLAIAETLASAGKTIGV